MDKACAVHRLDRCLHRFSETSEPSGKAAKTIGVRRRGASLDRPARLIEQAEIETLAIEIQSGVQHCVGPPFVSRGRAEHDSAGGPSSSHSLPWRIRLLTAEAPAPRGTANFLASGVLECRRTGSRRRLRGPAAPPDLSPEPGPKKGRAPLALPEGVCAPSDEAIPSVHPPSRFGGWVRGPLRRVSAF